ncbi:MAG: fasciclin domain-containing protein [Solirubrobacteraceae bacterium]
MKRLLISFATVAAFAVPVAATAAPGLAQASSTMNAKQNIVKLAASDPQLSTLVSLVKKAGLVGALSGKAKLTVFAPTNAAFKLVPKATLAKLDKDKALLVKVLEYHVVSGSLPAAKVEMLHSAKTLEGQRVQFKVKGGHAFVNNAEVIKANVMASNGIVHIINRVLIPA